MQTQLQIISNYLEKCNKLHSITNTFLYFLYYYLYFIFFYILYLSIDKTCNQHGKSFLEFLNDSRCCILNGRFGEESEEYTFYSTRGHSVVDYICLPLDNFTLCQNFQITKCTDLVERYNLYHRLGERSKIPDHNVLTIDLKVYSQLQTDNQRDSQNKKTLQFPANSCRLSKFSYRHYCY